VPSKFEHITKADGNAAFAMSLPLDSQTRIDWPLIALFYAAMHYVEAYLATLGQHVRSHTTRDTFLGRDANLRKIYSEYQDLKFYGYAARYEAFRFKAEDVTNQAAQHFATIKASLQPLL
jgi:hypothetical protein